MVYLKEKEGKKEKDFLFLLGAGASAAAEPPLPTAYGMTKCLIDEVKELGDPDLSRTLSLILGGIQFRRGLQGNFPEHDINIEDVAATLDVLQIRHTHELSPFVGSWNELLRTIDGNNERQRNCLKELGELLQEKIKFWLEAPEIGGIRYFSALQDFVNKFGCIDIFTLNYDQCVEKVLEHCHIPFTCGLDSKGWNSDLFSHENFNVSIYKLHGSLDWYRDEEDHNIYSTRIPPEDRMLVAAPRPLLIFGTAYKLTAIDPFLHLSYTFSEMVKARAVIVIVGYGFGDDYINKILLQGLSRDSRKRLIVVGKEVDDARSTFQNRFDPEKVFLSAKRVTFVGGGASQALSNGSLLKELESTLKEATGEGPFRE